MASRVSPGGKGRTQRHSAHKVFSKASIVDCSDDDYKPLVGSTFFNIKFKLSGNSIPFPSSPLNPPLPSQFLVPGQVIQYI